MPPVNSYVTEVKVQGDSDNQTATITVRLEGFEKDEHVQLSGYAAQKDGGFVAISQDYRIDSVVDGATQFEVDATPTQPFVKDTQVISALWAAKVWLTVLKVKDGGDGLDWVPDYSAPQY
jgi:hypothetical protein